MMRLTLMSAVMLSVLGMMLVVAGVLATGLFLPGVVLIGLSFLAYAAAAVLEAMRPGRDEAAVEVRAPRQRPRSG